MTGDHGPQANGRKVGTEQRLQGTATSQLLNRKAARLTFTSALHLGLTYPARITGLIRDCFVKTLLSWYAVPRLALLHELAVLPVLIICLAMLHPVATRAHSGNLLAGLALLAHSRLFGAVPSTCIKWQKRKAQRQGRYPS
jgi:hypothetical protein